MEDLQLILQTFTTGGTDRLSLSDTAATGLQVMLLWVTTVVAGVGELQGANGDSVLDASTGEHAVYGAANAHTMMYHTGVKKFETASRGVSIIGNIDLTPRSSDINVIANSGAALEMQQGSDLDMRFITTNGGEKIQVNKNIELQGMTATSGTFSSTINCM